MATMETEPTPAFDITGVRWIPVSPRLTTVRVVTAVVFLGIPTIIALIVAVIAGGWAWAAPAGLALIALWALWLIPRQVRAIGYAEQEEDLAIRKRSEEHTSELQSRGHLVCRLLLE